LVGKKRRFHHYYSAANPFMRDIASVTGVREREVRKGHQKAQKNMLGTHPCPCGEPRSDRGVVGWTLLNLPGGAEGPAACKRYISLSRKWYKVAFGCMQRFVFVKLAWCFSHSIIEDTMIMKKVCLSSLDWWGVPWKDVWRVIDEIVKRRIYLMLIFWSPCLYCSYVAMRFLTISGLYLDS
jgi:hypothetical protein